MQKLLESEGWTKCHHQRMKHVPILLFAIVLTLLSEAVLAQTIKITGQFSNEAGEPIPGTPASIKKSAITAAENGNYEINASVNGSSIISFADKIDAGSEVVVV